MRIVFSVLALAGMPLTPILCAGTEQNRPATLALTDAQDGQELIATLTEFRRAQEVRRATTATQ